jgi:carboxyl-terminal processing protease
MIDRDIGYVELTVFSESSTEELRAAIDKLRAQGAKGIVLDMRANSGGLLDQGVAVSDLFLPDELLVVETRGRLQNANEKYVTVDDGSYEGMPVVVLVSERSASATEIVAGALQDHDRALVLGRTTFGKGSVQTVYPLSNSNWLKLTTGKWFTPSGRSIQRPFGDEHPIEEIAEPGTGGAAGAAGDEKEAKPEYKTDAGRVVYGGGGITPDLMIPPDTLTSDERIFLNAVQDNWTKYLETRFAFSVRYNKENPNLEPGFTVTDQTLDEFYTALQQAGLDIERSVYDGARRWIEIQLGYEITYGKWGVAEARRRENTRDPQVAAAVDLLKRSPDPQSLFAAAAAHPAAKTASARGGQN